MRIKHGGKLSKAYFKSYMKLIMNTRDCSLEESSSITLEGIFGEEKDGTDVEVYQNYLKAFEELRDINTD
ncbi:hypothetical protein SAMN05216232_1072 [Virgibacillus subterraneus]|uniref:YozE SAM-like domain-containing protein n=1 Tax=Virgibacillus subterraneus TaxID=621109 RepID=A0A1H9B736_9BACI|nr:hypothetical protein [Virgibacillus subterraneus]SEP84822.1 hypothetical protein SAMN05216232_1072 [Virgibacillus subterraneus]